MFSVKQDGPPHCAISVRSVAHASISGVLDANWGAARPYFPTGVASDVAERPPWGSSSPFDERTSGKPCLPTVWRVTGVEWGRVGLQSSGAMAAVTREGPLCWVSVQ